MRALQILKPREHTIVELDQPEPAADEVVVKMEYAAMCNQNDYKIYYGLYGDLITYPMAPGAYGHEGVGLVHAVGSNVNDPKEGDRVVLMGVGGPMLYREYVERKAASVISLADHVSAQEAAVLELFGCAYHCMGITGDVEGKTVGLSGLGPAGLAILQLLQMKKPAEIVGIEIAEERAKAGRALGLERIVDPSDQAQLDALVEEGLDVVIDATGVPQAILNAFEITKHEVVIFGFTNKPFEVDQSKWFHKEMIIKNSRVQTIDDLRAVIKLLEDGKIKTADFITDVVSYDQYAEAVERLYKKEAIKILLEW